MGFNDFFRAVLRQDSKQRVQRTGIVGSGNRSESTPSQAVGDVGFQQPFDHIDHAGRWVAYQMYRTA